MSKIISISNHKGGVGKTTSTINIGTALARSKRNVLLIDLDPQFNLTQSLGKEEGQDKSIYGALKGEYPLEPVEVVPGVDLIPSSINLIKAEIELSYEFKREELLTKLIEPVKKDYDYILIDCPPSLGILTINAFVASDLIFVPIQAEFLALKGYTVLAEAIGRVGLQIDKLFITRYDKRKVLNRNVLGSIREALPGKVFNTVIRENIALAEAPAEGKDIFQYDNKSTGAEDYISLTEEILNEY